MKLDNYCHNLQEVRRQKMAEAAMKRQKDVGTLIL